jgi:hypothetical protein
MGKHQAKSAAAKNGGSYHPQVAHGRRVRKVEPFRILFEIVASLEAAHISHAVTKYRNDAISIVAHLPGERWEIDILEDGDLDFERFVSDGQILEREDLNVYIKRFAD